MAKKKTKTAEPEAKKAMVQLTVKVDPGAIGKAEAIAVLLGLGTPRSLVQRAAMNFGLAAFAKARKSELRSLVEASL
jgi:hypothetical protein